MSKNHVFFDSECTFSNFSTPTATSEDTHHTIITTIGAETLLYQRIVRFGEEMVENEFFQKCQFWSNFVPFISSWIRPLNFFPRVSRYLW